MAFENIGIGGVLDFESKKAVTNMGAAERAFGSLSRAGANARAGIAKVGEGLGAFQLMGGLGVAGLVIGFEKLVHAGMEWNEYVQTAQISIGTIMAAVTKTPLDQNIKGADKVLQHLNIVATQTHVETSEVVDTFSRLVGPLMGAGASMEYIYENVKGTTILASALHQPVNRASHAISMLAGGTLIAKEQTIQLLHSMNLLHENSTEWAAYNPEQRLKRLSEIMATFEQSGEYLQHTWVAQESSAKSFLKIMAGAFTKGMFDKGTGALETFNNAFIKHQDEWLAKINTWGMSFVQAINWATREVLTFYNTMHKTMEYIQAKLSYFEGSGFPPIIGQAAHLLAQFMLFATALSPVVSIIGFIGGKVMALWSIFSGLVSIIAAIAVPLLVIGAIAAGLFMLLRHEGESFTQTIMRFWDYIQTLGAELWAPIAEALPTVIKAFEQLTASGAKLWTNIQPGLEQFRQVLDGAVTLVVTLWEAIAPILANIFAGAVRIFQALRPGIEAIFNGVMRVANAVMIGINYIVPKLMPIIDAIVQGVLFIGEKAGMIFSKLAGLLSPLLSAIEYIFMNILWPVLGFLIDVFGPIFIGVWKAVIWILGKVLDAIGWLIDAIKWLIEGVGGGLKWAFEGIVTIIQWIGDKIMWLVGKITWVYDKTVGLLKSLNQMLTDTEGIDEIVTGNQKALEMLKPEVKNSAEIAKTVTGTAEIKAAKPDVNVNVDIKNNATMCVNGRNLAVAQSAYETEVAERSGFNKTPWQTQRVQIQGVKP